MEFFLRLIQFFAKLIHFVIYSVLLKAVPKKCQQTIPPIKNQLLTLSVIESVRWLKFGKVTSKQLVQAYIDRIKEVNPYINAVIEECFEQALENAQRADALIQNCQVECLQILFEKYPILGIPFTVKEACGVKGMSHVVGSLSRLNKKSDHDCEPVTNLRLAGGIPLLVSANPEYCFSIETNTFTNGRCLNPYNFKRTCGGSSGGEGALNGSGASLFGIGSDIAGSIRIPSLFNGVFGHKPTGGFMPTNGHFPNSIDAECVQYLQMGPITRFGSDLPFLLQIMSGGKFHACTHVKIKQVHIHYLLGFKGYNGFLHQTVDYDIKACIIKAVKYYTKLGLETKPANIKGFVNSTEISITAIARLHHLNYLLKDDHEPPTIRSNLNELINNSLGKSNYTKEALMFELLRATNAFMGAKNTKKYEVEAQLLKQELIDLLGENGVLFLPTFHLPAIHHNSSILPLWGGIDYCLIFNALGLPCTHIPMGLNRQGLPIGFQVVAAPNRDELCLHIAAELEQAFGGWVSP